MGMWIALRIQSNTQMHGNRNTTKTTKQHPGQSLRIAIGPQRHQPRRPGYGETQTQGPGSLARFQHRRIGHSAYRTAEQGGHPAQRHQPYGKGGNAQCQPGQTGGTPIQRADSDQGSQAGHSQPEKPAPRNNWSASQSSTFASITRCTLSIGLALCTLCTSERRRYHNSPTAMVTG